MKQFIYLSIFLVTIASTAQDDTSTNVPVDSLITSVELICPAKSSSRNLPFVTYHINAEQFNLVTQQDIYNALRAKVPGIQIANQTLFTGTPKIRIRNSDDTILLIDGVRYDLSVLGTLNPANIEKITVAPNNAALNYFLGKNN